ncbi:CSG1/SUR1-like protein [Elasticomyces elasticus]|nr:CSG1/SUR1-like protein [Elasticomyces elasticus]
MTFGSLQWQPWILNESAALPLLKHAFDLGINTWDTADVYSHGESERIIGKAIQQYKLPRQKLVIMTKCYFPVCESGDQPAFDMSVKNDGRYVNSMGLSRKYIFDAVDSSTDRLRTYIDVLQIHRLDRETDKTEIMRALNDVVESGKVRYIGASSMAAWEFQMLQNIAEKHGWHKFISMQNYHNLVFREEEREMIPYCKATGVGLLPWSPIARGALARPFNDTDRSHREQTDPLVSQRGRSSTADEAVINRVEHLAEKYGVSMACIATSWCLHHGDCPIVGLNSTSRMDQIVKGLSFRLSAEDARYLEEPYVPKPVTGY